MENQKRRQDRQLADKLRKSNDPYDQLRVRDVNDSERVENTNAGVAALVFVVIVWIIITLLG
jgi:hypothetical protein